MKNHYHTLGVNPDATADELKATYRKLVLKFHPDKNHGNLFFEERFQEIQEAYTILSNPEKRKIFDIIRSTSYDQDKDNTKFQEKDTLEQIHDNFEYKKTNITLLALLIIAITCLAVLVII